MKPVDTLKRNKFYHCLEYDHDQTGDICLITCGFEQCDKGVLYGSSVKDCYCIHAVQSGTGTLRINGQELHPKGGQLFLLTKSSKSPASIAKSNKQWVGTCLYQKGYKPLLINCGAVIWL